jgi:hypothetical protein
LAATRLLIHLSGADGNVFIYTCTPSNPPPAEESYRTAGSTAPRHNVIAGDGCNVGLAGIGERDQKRLVDVEKIRHLTVRFGDLGPSLLP